MLSCCKNKERCHLRGKLNCLGKREKKYHVMVVVLSMLAQVSSSGSSHGIGFSSKNNAKKLINSFLPTQFV